MTLRVGQSNGSIRAWRRHFPLVSLDNLMNLMREILVNSNFTSYVSDPSHSKAARLGSSDAIACVIEPDLAFVSIVLGFIENRLTSSTHEESAVSSRMKLPTTPCSSLKFASANANNRTLSSTVTTKVPPSPLSFHTTKVEGTPEKTSTVVPLATKDLHTADISHKDPLLSVTASESKTRAQLRRRSLIVPEVESPCHTSFTSSVLTVCTQSSGRSSLSATTVPPPMNKRRRFSSSSPEAISFPCLTFEEADRWYQDFHTLITTSPKLQPFVKEPPSRSGHSGADDTPRFATRALIRAVCEVLWTRMISSKSREKVTHTQSVYSFLSDGIVDSFGLAYTAVAACQLLDYSDVYLALSEDHGWVEFGPPDARQTADVAGWLQSVRVAHGHDCSGLTESHPAPAGSEGDEPNSKLAIFDDHCSPPPVRIPPWTHSWLYVNGYPVICHPRILAVAAAVAALQPGSTVVVHAQSPISPPAVSVAKSTPSCPTDLITPSKWARHLSTSPAISLQLVAVKHRLLWLFYESGCLARYPLGLTNLADLEDAFPSTLVSELGSDERLSSQHLQTQFAADCHNSSIDPVRSSSIALKLYTEAVVANKTHYANQHVYPYTSLAGYLYRHDDYRGALHYWSEAAQVIGQYNHSSDDWEVYRELLEIATQLMPHVFRCAAEASRFCSDGVLATDPDGCVYQPSNILDDPRCLAYLLAFYDHLCLWEEGSPVPVLHVGWVDKLMINLMRFSQRARRLLCLSVDESRIPQTEVDVNSPTLIHTRRSEHSSPSPVITSLPKRPSARRNRTPSRLHDQTNSTPTELAEHSASLTFQTPFGDESLAAPCTPASSVSTPPIVLSSIENRIDNAKSICTTDAFELKTTSPARKKSNSTSGIKLKTVDSSSILNPDGNSPLDTGVNEKIEPLTDGEVGELLTELYEESKDKWTPSAESDERDASPSSSPTVDFSTDDFLSSLAEACDHRLLNPAFLWGVEPDTPFLPENVAPEDAFTKLFVSLELKHFPTDAQSANLFLTPPDSGGSCTVEKAPIASSLSQHPRKSPLSDTDRDTALPFSNGSTDSVNETGLTNGTISGEFVSSVTRFASGASSPAGELDVNDKYVSLALHRSEFPSSWPNSTTGIEVTSESRQSTQPKSMEELIVHLTLHSTKMISIVDLLRASRLNASAIKLALTAQSQLCPRRSVHEVALAHV